MTKRFQNFETYTGNTEIITAQVLDRNEAAVDISGATVSWIAKDGIEATAATLEKDNGGNGGVSITDGPNGWIRITVSPSDTNSLADKKYYHECKVTLAGGEEKTVFTGTMRVFSSGYSTIP